jgi:tRNA modification GTPase
MNIVSTEDTIAAIATPPGIGAITIIRVSGTDAIKSVEKIFQPNNKKSLSKAETHTIHYGKIIDARGEIIDDVLVSIFKRPHSYTGEESVEISTHGNPFIAGKILEKLNRENVRLAEPGEFTKRAYLNNKLDLSQAEAVIDIITSRTDASLKGARNQLNGLLSKKVEELRSLLINTASFIELELDFAEEDLEFIQRDELLKRILTIKKELDQLLATYSFGRVVKDGVNAALVGQPNVGKSSLLNYILKESRAIVSSIPGTTRDVIREEVSIDGVLFRLFDTAGIRVSEDEIEKEGILRSREAVKNADLVLFINDPAQGFSTDLRNELLTLTDAGKIITVINKIDLHPEIENQTETIPLSALTGKGIDALFSIMISKALGNSVYSEKSAVVTNSRHYDCLERANSHLDAAVNAVNNSLPGEFISLDIKSSAAALGEIIGEVTSDDVLNNIFMKFCIGK